MLVHQTLGCKPLLAPFSCMRTLCTALFFVIGLPSITMCAHDNTPNGAYLLNQFGTEPVARETLSLLIRDTVPSSVDIWYPANQTANASLTDYDLRLFSVRSGHAYTGLSVRAGEKFPVILFSHGHNAIRFQSWTLMESLASHGFVVVSMDHHGDNLFDMYFGSPSTVGIDRVADLNALLDAVVAAKPDLIDANNIGLMGHSMGGRSIVEWVIGASNTLKDRIKAVAVIDGGGDIPAFSDQFTKPVMVFSASDSTYRYWSTTFAHGNGSGARCLFVDHPKAVHGSYSNICDILEASHSVTLPDDVSNTLNESADACAAGVAPAATVHLWTSRLAGTFFTTMLRQSFDTPDFTPEDWQDLLDQAGSPATLTPCESAPAPVPPIAMP